MTIEKFLVDTITSSSCLMMDREEMGELHLGPILVYEDEVPAVDPGIISKSEG